MSPSCSGSADAQRRNLHSLTAVTGRKQTLVTVQVALSIVSNGGRFQASIDAGSNDNNKVLVNQLRVLSIQIIVDWWLKVSRRRLGVYMRRYVIALSALTALAFATSASAQQAPAGQYTFSFTDASGSSGTGLFTVVSGGLVTGVSGTVYDTQAVGGPISTTITGPSAYAGADNILYTNAPFVDFAGISLLLGDLNNLNLFYSNGTYEISGTRDEYLTTNPCGCVGETDFSASLSVAAVPEPATWAMMLLGFGAIGFTMRQRLRPRISGVA